MALKASLLALLLAGRCSRAEDGARLGLFDWYRELETFGKDFVGLGHKIPACAFSGPCSEGISRRPVAASGLVFDCRFAGEGGSPRGDVMLLHGFGLASSWFEPILHALADAGFRAVACDQRGYSYGALPENLEDYNYNKLRDDIFAVADAIGFDKFHLMGHNHGAVLGWYATNSDAGKARLLSFSAFSIPHIDAFSAGMIGEQADLEQQMQSQYFSVLAQPDIVSRHGYALWLTVGIGLGFTCPTHFQKALWWYHGAFDAGVMARPPNMNATYLADNGATASSWLRTIFGGEEDEGLAQTVPTGAVSLPVLFVCGSQDTFVLCDKPFAHRTVQYVKADYQHLVVDCGHILFPMCNSEDTQRMLNALVHRVETAQPSKNTAPIVA